MSPFSTIMNSPTVPDYLISCLDNCIRYYLDSGKTNPGDINGMNVVRFFSFLRNAFDSTYPDLGADQKKDQFGKVLECYDNEIFDRYEPDEAGLDTAGYFFNEDEFKRQMFAMVERIAIFKRTKQLDDLLPVEFKTYLR